MVPSTTIWPVPVTSRAVAFAIGWTAKPVVHTVTAAGMALPSAVVTWSASTPVTAVCSYAVIPSLPKTFRRCSRPLGESQSPRPPLGGEGDVEVRAGLGDLGRGLHAGEAAADDDHGLPGVEAGQALAQPERSGAAGDLVGVLGGPGDALGVPAAAEGVDERVVGEFFGAVRVGDGDGLAVDVDAGDLREPQFDAGAREHLAERPGLEVLAGRQLVHADAFDEVGLGVDEGDGDVLAAEPLGEAAGGDGSGVSGSEDDDAVLHFRAPVRARICPLNRAARRFLTGTRCEAPHTALRSVEQGLPVVGDRPLRGRAVELVGVDLVYGTRRCPRR